MTRKRTSHLLVLGFALLLAALNLSCNASVGVGFSVPIGGAGYGSVGVGFSVPIGR